MDLGTYTVLEVGEYVAVPYAGKLLAALGADVVKVEPPGGDVARRVGPFPDDDPDPEASGYFGFLNTDKRGITLDPERAPAAAVVRELIEALDVDLVIEDRLADYGVDPRALADAYDDLSVVSVTGFGATGPWAGYDVPEIVAAAESGQMNKMGYPDRPPTRLRIKSLEYIAAEFAALAAVAALYHRDAGGADGQYVDVSKREAGAACMEFFFTGYSWSGHTTQRIGNGYPEQGPRESTPTFMEAADGYFSGLTTRKWDVLCTEIMDRPDLLADERFATMADRSENRLEMREIVQEYTRERGKWDLFYEFQEHGIASGVVATPEDVVGFDQLEGRDFWGDVPLPNGEVVTMPGFPFRANGTPIEAGRAPRLGEHDAEVYGTLGYDRERLVAGAAGDGAAGDRDARPGDSGPGTTGSPMDPPDEGPAPFEDIKVIDFTWVGAGPQATKFLAGLGADVVKIESLRKPDQLRYGSTFDFDPEETLNASAHFAEFNQDKRSIQLDLNTDRGQEIARELIAEADVLAENFSPTYMDRIGLDYESVRGLNPDLVYLSMPGWGSTGPAATYRSYGPRLQAMAGLDWLSGFPDDPPTTAGQAWPDPVAGNLGSVAMAMALLHRANSGEGTHVELAQYEATVQFLHKPIMEFLLHERLPERMGNRDEDLRYVQGTYECAGDDRWAVVAVETNDQWRRCCRAIGRPALAADERFASRYRRLEHHDAVDEAIEAWTCERSPEEVRERLRAHDVPVGIVADERDLMDYDPQLRVREFFPEYDFPDIGHQRCGGIPIAMADARVAFDRHPPSLGEHTEEVLSEWLGWSPEEVERDREEKILY